MAKAPDAATLEERVKGRGFTPGQRDLEPLLDLLARADDDARVLDVERAIARAGRAALAPSVERARKVDPAARARIVRVVGRLAASVPESAGFLLETLADDDARTRRYAAAALAKLPKGTPGVEDAMLSAWEKEARVDVRRALADALGKVGSPRALERLREAEAAGDPELARIASRASLRIARDEVRGAGGSIDVERAPAQPVPINVHCRAGLERLVREELAERCAATVGLRSEAGLAPEPGAVPVLLRGPLRELWRVRTLLDFAFDLGVHQATSAGDVERLLVQAMTAEGTRRILEGLSVGPVRYRIAWGSGGHRRAAVWRVARAVAEARPAWVNDPKASPWEIVALEDARRSPAEGVARPVGFELRPRGLVDPRFAYRKRDVPGASHPTIAAALVRVAGGRPDDVVWDPFVGSGTELVERAVAGPYARLHGSDVDPRALEAARANLEAAGLPVMELARANALEHAPRGVTLVLTNPPMGRRVRREVGLLAELDAFVEHAARVLRPGGRLVWISPTGERTREVARRAGLRVALAFPVDMGGFSAEVQRLDKPGRV